MLQKADRCDAAGFALFPGRRGRRPAWLRVIVVLSIRLRINVLPVGLHVGGTFSQYGAVLVLWRLLIIQAALGLDAGGGLVLHGLLTVAREQR